MLLVLSPCAHCQWCDPDCLWILTWLHLSVPCHSRLLEGESGRGSVPCISTAAFNSSTQAANYAEYNTAENCWESRNNSYYVFSQLQIIEGVYSE